MKETPAERIAELDTLRGIAITAVVGLHVTWGYLLVAPLGHTAGKTAAALHLLTGFGVPLFVMLSGIGLALRYSEPMTARAYGSFLQHRAARLLPAYLSWSLLVAAGTDPALLWPPGRLASLLLTGGAGPQFYFIPLIAGFYLLWPLLRPLARVASISPAHAIATAAAGAALSAGCWKLSSMGLVPAGTLTLPAFFLLYMVAGLALAPHLGHLSRVGLAQRLAAGVLVAAAAMLMFLGFLAMVHPPSSTLELRMASTIFRPASMFYIYAAMALAFAVVFGRGESRTAAGLARLGRHSYGIFLIHILLLGVGVERFLGAPAPEQFLEPWWILRMAAGWALCLALSYAVTRAFSRLTVLSLS